MVQDQSRPLNQPDGFFYMDTRHIDLEKEFPFVNMTKFGDIHSWKKNQAPKLGENIPLKFRLLLVFKGGGVQIY